MLKTNEFEPISHNSRLLSRLLIIKADLEAINKLKLESETLESFKDIKCRVEILIKNLIERCEVIVDCHGTNTPIQKSTSVKKL